MVLTKLRRTKESSKVSSTRRVGPGKGSSFQSVATGMSLRRCALPAKSTCAQMMSLGALRSSKLWITACDHLGHCFIGVNFFFLPPFLSILLACLVLCADVCLYMDAHMHCNNKL